MGSTFRLANQKLNILWSFSAAGGGGLFKSEAPHTHTHTGALKYCSFSCGNPTSCTLLLCISPGVKSDDKILDLWSKGALQYLHTECRVLVAKTNNHWGSWFVSLVQVLPYQAAAFQTSSLEGCLSDSRQLCQREITHQLSQGGACKTGKKLWFLLTNHIKDRFENLFAFIEGGG